MPTSLKKQIQGAYVVFEDTAFTQQTFEKTFPNVTFDLWKKRGYVRYTGVYALYQLAPNMKDSLADAEQLEKELSESLKQASNNAKAASERLNKPSKLPGCTCCPLHGQEILI